MDSPEARAEEMGWLEKVGVQGVKVDFFGGDKQAGMQLYNRHPHRRRPTRPQRQLPRHDVAARLAADVPELRHLRGGDGHGVLHV